MGGDTGMSDFCAWPEPGFGMKTANGGFSGAHNPFFKTRPSPTQRPPNINHHLFSSPSRESNSLIYLLADTSQRHLVFVTHKQLTCLAIFSGEC